jgi:hypothetical protein
VFDSDFAPPAKIRRVGIMDDDHDEDDFDTSSDDDDTTMPCPHCGEDVYDDAEQCPLCGQYLSREDAPAAARPWWILIGVAVCLVIVILWMLGG